MDSNPNAPLPRPDAAQLRCLLLCDLADSTALIEKLGDVRAAELMRRHDRVARDTLQRFHGQEIDKTDGFLLLFERPIEAVRFALAYQRSLRELGSSVGQPLRARVGIHVGEILTRRNAADAIAGGAKPVEVEGLAKAIAARLMGLAEAGQTLLSESAFSLAQRARAELDDPATARWLDHGRYRLKGVARPMHVFEVGNDGIAPLAPPANSAKAHQIRPWYYWKPLYAAAAMVAAVLPLWWLLKPTPAIAFAERDWLVVGDVRNLTGDSRYDASLDAAIRIALDQSRYVNLVASAKTRDVLKLMERDPSTRIDRDIGAEVAQRVGARALLLPSLAEVAGEFRFTAELVDPRTGATVYSNFAEAKLTSDVLAAIDNTLRDVREDLGEKLDAIDKNAQPLPSVATSNLDALRAYALGLGHESNQQFEEARQSFELALSLDPDFSAPRAGIARYWFVRGDLKRSIQEFRRVIAAPQRLSDRERLSYEATLASLEYSSDHIARWKALLALYPDSHAAAHNTAIFLWDDNHFEEAARYAEIARARQSPTVTSSTYVKAMAELGLANLSSASQLYEMASNSGGEQPVRICASIRLAESAISAARACLASLAPKASRNQRAEAAWFDAVLSIDGNDSSGLERSLTELEAILSDQPEASDAPLSAALVAARIRMENSNIGGAAMISRAIRTMDELAGIDESSMRAQYVARCFLAYIALEIGQGDLAKSTLPARQERLSGYQFAVHATVAAAIQAHAGDAAEAVSALRQLVDGNEPMLTRIVLVKALETAGDLREASELKREIAGARLRALAEFTESQLMLGEYLWQIRGWSAPREPRKAVRG